VLASSKFGAGIRSLLHGYHLYAATEIKSPNSQAIVIRRVNYLCHFLDSNGLSTDVTRIGTTEIRAFILYLKHKKCFSNHPYSKPQQKGLSGHSINTYMRSIRAFWSWLLRERLIHSNPFSTVKIPKAPRKVITPFSEEQIHSLIQAIDTSTTAGLRDYAMVLMLLDTGMRLGELISLKNNDVDLRNRTLKVFGKGAKERRVPIGKRLLAALWKYQLYRSQPATGSIDNFSLTRDGWPLTKNRVETIVKNLGRKVGLQGVRCSPHNFRHTFCIQFLRNGANLLTLQQMTGHSSLEVLRGYVVLAESDVKIAHQKFSPADNLNLKRPYLGKKVRAKGSDR
jgi:integrase/recombinase XerD